MNPVTGKIGKAAVRNADGKTPMTIRLQMKPGETLVVRIVRERSRGIGNGDGFQEFESLPDWEYEGENPKPEASARKTEEAQS